MILRPINNNTCKIGGYFGVKPHDRPSTMQEKMDRHAEAVTQDLISKEAALEKLKIVK